MQEWSKRAAEGWQQYITAGKYAVLFLAGAGFLLLSESLADNGNKTGKTQSRKLFFCYALLSAFCVICPVTAALLMKYQTAYSDYADLFGLVPVTGILAAAAACILTKVSGKKRIAAVAVCLLLLCLCGNLSRPVWRQIRTQSLQEGKGQKSIGEGNEECWIAAAAPALKENAVEEICLWAPEEILKDVRAKDAEICLIYGRNLWDQALNAWSYDSYDTAIRAMYEWMEREDYRAGKETTTACVRAALERGVNCMVLPRQQTSENAENDGNAEDAENEGSLLKQIEEAALAMGIAMKREVINGYEVCFFTL